MLQTIRDKLTGWVAGTIFAIIALAFMFWGIDPLSINATWAAKVNGAEIPAAQVRNAAQNRISQLEAAYRTELPPAARDQIRNEVIGQFVNNRLLAQRAEDEGYRVSDFLLQQRIRSLPYFQIGGEFSSDSYRALLRGQGLSVSGFERDQRSQLEIEQLQQGVSGTAFVTPGEMRRYLELLREQRTVTVLTVPASRYDDLTAPDEEQIVAYYETDPNRFLTQESATVEFIEIRAEDYAGQVDIDEEELVEFYEQAADRYRTEEQRRARHILVAMSSERDEEAAEEIATEVAGKARAGEDFAALVAEYSDDGGTVPDAGDLGWSAREDFVGPFADALFTMEVGEIAGPVKTRFGYHVIVLDDVQPEAVSPLDEVRAEIETEYRAFKAEDLYYEAAEGLYKSAFEADSYLQGVAEDLGLELQTVENFTRSGGGPLGTDPALIAAVFSDDVLLDRRNSELIEVDDSRALVLRVSDHQPAEPRPLGEVRDQIVAFLITEKARDLAAETGAAIEAELIDGRALEEVAAENGARIDEPVTLTRDSAESPRILVEAVFATPRPASGSPAVGSVMLPGGDYAVFSVDVVSPGQPAALSIEEWNNMEQQLANQIGQGEFVAYLNELRNEASVQINERTFDDTIQAPPVLP